ncbi:MAG TPA: hemerythrin domain-containing protein [Blastocatellia bacterium]|jgi:hemerythrin-like domain-containing protein|nr:hemerythrin domain-containing protein [Blastocatellia bacterium]
MAVTIGKKAESDFTNPLGLLNDCHRRIEYFLSLLVTVARRARGRKLHSDEREALEAALRYFKQAAPKHTLDEEESLFPRMRASGDVLAQSAVAVLNALHRDHTIADETHKEVDALARRWLDEGQLSEGEAHRLEGMLEDLAEIYRRHIAIEDNEIFPLAGKILSQPELEAMGHEMAARRGVDPSRRTL